MSEVDEFKAQLASLRVRMQSVEDQLAISQLVAEYAPSVDSESADDVAALWAEDGVYSVTGGEMSLDMNGRGEIAAIVSGPYHQATIAQGSGHILTTPHIRVDGNQARARSHAMLVR